ncbi:MAG: AmmeMemoRadiSam system protein A [Gammaproteobacteria bacterium]
MPSTDATLDAAARALLREIADASIRHGLQSGNPLPVEARDYPESLRAPGASFVTLHRHGELRGCIGSLEAYRPLVTDVADNAFAAAFRDPRFAPLRTDELADLELHISVLSAPRALDFRDEADLLRQLRPGVDGLILTADGHRGTFLPSVWESLPRPEQFLAQLKRKAGLPADYWSPALRVQRYTTEAF